MLTVELSRYRVLPGKSARVDEWLAYLNQHMPDVLLTLEDEKMYVETIFRETVEGVEYLYWYSVQGPGGQEVESSQHEVDIQHLKYWEECIDSSYGMQNLSTEVVMIPERIRQVMTD